MSRISIDREREKERDREREKERSKGTIRTVNIIKVQNDVNLLPDFNTHPLPTLRGFNLYIPLVLIWEISDASSILASSPIVTKSWDVGI